MLMRTYVQEAGISGRESHCIPHYSVGSNPINDCDDVPYFSTFTAFISKWEIQSLYMKFARSSKGLVFLISICFLLYTPVSLSVQILRKSLSPSCHHYAAGGHFNIKIPSCQHRDPHTYIRNIMNQLGIVMVCSTRNDRPLGYCKSNAITLKASVNSVSDAMPGHY